jgi:carbamoyltransferase
VLYWGREDLTTAFEIPPAAIRARFHRIEHRAAHLAGTFYVSPFERAALLSADGLEDFASSMRALVEGPHMGHQDRALNAALCLRGHRRSESIESLN